MPDGLDFSLTCRFTRWCIAGTPVHSSARVVPRCNGGPCNKARHAAQRIGITKEAWFLAQGTSGELLVAYIETENFANALGLFSSSQDDFDLWFKRRLADSTGLDLNTPPEMSLPELHLELQRGGARLALQQVTTAAPRLSP